MRRTQKTKAALLLTAGVSLVLVSISLWPSPAGATPVDDPPEQCANPQDCIQGSGDVDLEREELEATINFTAPGSGGTFEIPTGESIFADCIVELVMAGDSVSKFGPLVTANLAGSVWDEDYWVIDCNPGTLANLYFYPDGPFTPPAWIVNDMIADAYKRTPVVAFNPISSPDGDEDISLVVHVPTYLWVDSVAWQTSVSATATIPGGFSVTTTATPALASWSGGEDPIDCDTEDMVPYDPTLGEDGQTSGCTMIYRQSSALGDFSIDLAVTWTVGYTCSTGACGGPLPDLVTSSTRDVVVKEIQAVGSPNP